MVNVILGVLKDLQQAVFVSLLLPDLLDDETVVRLLFKKSSVSKHKRNAVVSWRQWCIELCTIPCIVAEAWREGQRSNSRHRWLLIRNLLVAFSSWSLCSITFISSSLISLELSTTTKKYLNHPRDEERSANRPQHWWVAFKMKRG